MGCACKDKRDHIAKKYGIDVSEKTKIPFLLKPLFFIAQLIMGIFMGCIIIVIGIPLIVYFVLFTLFGLQPYVNLHKIIKIVSFNGRRKK